MGQFRVAYFPSDLGRSGDFYIDVLGFDVIDSWDRPDSQGMLLDAGAGTVELLAPAPSGGHVVGSALSLSVEVDDVDRRWQMLTDRGLQDLAQPTTQPWGHRSISIEDPDGVTITFFQDLGH